MRVRNFAAALLAMIATSAQAAERAPLLHIGNWTGGSYTNETNGGFSHCAVGANYLDGIRLMVSVNGQMGWTLGFAHASWQLQVGQVVPIDLTFDGRGPFHVFAQVIQPTLAFAQMPDNSQLIRLFRGANQMSVFAQGHLFNFTLTNTAQVLPALVDCVRQNTGMPLRVAVPPPIATPSPPAATVSALNPANADLHAEAAELAMNFVLGAKVDGPKILGKGDTPADFVSFGAEWKGSDAAGVVKIIPGGPDMKGIDVAAAVISADAKECKGKFASARSSDMVDSEVVFRGISSCEDSAGPRSAQYFIVPRKAGGFVLFSVIASGSASTDKSSSTPIGDPVVYRKAALTAVN